MRVSLLVVRGLRPDTKDRNDPFHAWLRTALAEIGEDG